jgi:hypothetical protein
MLVAAGCQQPHLRAFRRGTEQDARALCDAVEIAGQELRLLDGKVVQLRLALRPLAPGNRDLHGQDRQEGGGDDEE